MRAAGLAALAVLAAAAVLGVGAGCWTSGPTPARPSPPAPPPGEPGAIEPISCADVGAVLRGKVPHSTDDPTDAGPAKERAIVQACVEDAWPRAVIECVGRGKKDCLAQLTAAQRRTYEGRLERWRARYSIDPPDDDDDDSDDDDSDDDADTP